MIFFAANYDAPFLVKKRVLEAAFMSSILYGCENWLNMSLKPVEMVYLKAIKALLGVRITTSNSLCIVESGFKPLNGLVKERQKKFFTKMTTLCADIQDDPFMHSMKITEDLNNSMWRYIDNTIRGDNFVESEVQELKEQILNAPPTKSKFQMYKRLNPNLEVHSLYSKNAPVVPDYLRITFTRFRLCSHRLRVELGRWSRTPREERICGCGEGIQDEFHIFQCPLTKDIFSSDQITYNSPDAIFQETSVEELQMLHRALERLNAENEERT